MFQKSEKSKPVKRSKAEVQTIRKAQGMRIVRVILWIMLTFIFVRGVVAILQDDSESQVVDLQQYQEELAADQTRIEQLLPFAEDFAREYLTYRNGEEQDYMQRLSTYAAPSLFSGIRLTEGSAEALNATAYRHEAYSETQEDVWVRLQVRYTTKERNLETDEIVEVQKLRETTLKIPVAYTADGYIVEDLPAFVSDSRKATDFKAESYAGTSADRDTQEAVEAALGNFFKAYYTEDQSVIKYYLTPDAELSDFLGLDGRVEFGRIAECKVYRSDDSDALLAIVGLEVRDVNGMTVPQRFHLELQQQDGQFRVRSIHTRSKNISN